jgi:hypothetical protein
MMRIAKNPTPVQIRRIIETSAHTAARRIHDPRTNDWYYWPAEDGYHAAGAELLGVPYDQPAGGGDIVV